MFGQDASTTFIVGAVSGAQQALHNFLARIDIREVGNLAPADPYYSCTKGNILRFVLAASPNEPDARGIWRGPFDSEAERRERSGGASRPAAEVRRA